MIDDRKKILLLGGKPIGSCEIVDFCRQNNIYIIVADNLSEKESYAKQLADESWLISTADLDLLEKKARENEVDGVIAGVHEFNIQKAIELCNRLELTPQCSLQQWKICNNKISFKNLCKAYEIPVTIDYLYDQREVIKYPVICKPSDSSGSRGFSICNNITELIMGYSHALEFSEAGEVLIEKYMPYDSVIIHYSFINGKAYFSGISDKKSMVLNGGGSVMAIQTFPAKHIADYLEKIDEKAKRMFNDLGIMNGILWIEAFDDAGDFTFNEIGLRFGGSLTYHPVNYFTGIDQLRLLVNCVIGEPYEIPVQDRNRTDKYAILPLHVKSGKISKISGVDKVKVMQEVFAYVPVHFEGDEIFDWNSAQQVFCYIHILYNDVNKLKMSIKLILEVLHVESAEGEELLFCLFDYNSLK